jgi:hypothetical protein
MARIASSGMAAADGRRDAGGDHAGVGWNERLAAMVGIGKLRDQASAGGFGEDALRQDTGPGGGLVADAANCRYGVALGATSAVEGGAEPVGGALYAEEVLSAGVKPGSDIPRSALWLKATAVRSRTLAPPFVT